MMVWEGDGTGTALWEDRGVQGLNSDEIDTEIWAVRY